MHVYCTVYIQVHDVTLCHERLSFEGCPLLLRDPLCSCCGAGSLFYKKDPVLSPVASSSAAAQARSASTAALRGEDTRSPRRREVGGAGRHRGEGEGKTDKPVEKRVSLLCTYTYIHDVYTCTELKTKASAYTQSA